MPKLLENPLPLRELRTAEGLTDERMAEELTVKLGRPITAAYVRLVEHRGTRVYDYIAACADILNRPIETVAEAAKPLRK